MFSSSTQETAASTALRSPALPKLTTSCIRSCGTSVYFQTGRLVAMAQMDNKLKFQTKARTLESLKPILKSASIKSLFYFNVNNWSQSSQAVLDEIAQKFGNAKLIVRSSAISANSWICSSESGLRGLSITAARCGGGVCRIERS